MKLRIHRFLPLTKAEGPGKRACLWVQGCSIHCKGCGVPWTWSETGGKVVDIQNLYEEIMLSKEENNIEGITFLGGEPFDQASSLAELARKLKRAGLSIMTFSGYTYETLKDANQDDWNELLEVTDLLVDGPFVKEKLDLSRPWVGSSNQNYRFLSNCYIHLKNTLLNIPNKLEIRIEPSGKILVNGMAAPDTLLELFKNIGSGASSLKK